MNCLTYTIPQIWPVCDFHLFPNLKGHFNGKHFKDDNELKIVTEEWLQGEDKTIYLSCIENL